MQSSLGNMWQCMSIFDGVIYAIWLLQSCLIFLIADVNMPTNLFEHGVVILLEVQLELV